MQEVMCWKIFNYEYYFMEDKKLMINGKTVNSIFKICDKKRMSTSRFLQLQISWNINTDSH